MAFADSLREGPFYFYSTSNFSSINHFNIDVFMEEQIGNNETSTGQLTWSF